MGTIDLTKNTVTTSGNHYFLLYALRKAEEDHIALYGEIASFKPGDEYPNSTPDVAHFLAFGRRVFRSEVNIVLVAASLVEAMANIFYSEHADDEMFSIIERASPIEKWVTLPKMYIPSYSFPRDGRLFHILKTLISRRNSITHPKPHMVKGEDVLHKGNVYKRTSDEYKLHLEFCKLPSLLVQHLKSHDTSAGTNLGIMFLILPDMEPLHLR